MPITRSGMQSGHENRWVSYLSAREPAADATPAHTGGKHGDGALNFLGIDLEDTTTKILITGSLLAGGLVLAPIVLPALGIGENIVDAAANDSLRAECCYSVGNNVGIASTITEAVKSIPVIGSYLDTSEGNYILAPAITMLSGQAAGGLIEQMEKKQGKKGAVGAAIRVTSMAIGVVLALPALLPSVGHAVQFLARLAGQNMEEVAKMLPEAENISVPNAELGKNIEAGFRSSGQAIARVLGNAGDCPSIAFDNKVGLKTGASLLAGHAPCLLPAFITTAPALAAALGMQPKEVRRQEATSLGR